MGFILITILAVVIGIVSVYLSTEKDIGGDVLAAVGAFLILYGTISVIPFFGHNDIDDDLKNYEKSKAKLEIIKEKENLPIGLIMDFKYDINSTNKLIEKSKKYHDNWFLSSFYYKEIGELDKLETDSILTSVKVF